MLHQTFHQLLRIATLALLTALMAPAATYYVTISGLGGEPDYDQRFKGWATDIDSSLNLIVHLP